MTKLPCGCDEKEVIIGDNNAQPNIILNESGWW